MESPARVRELEALGVTFDADRHGNLALGLEGGHSVRRIVHAGGSATGRRITRELSARAATDDRIHVLEPAAAVALWTLDGRCIGLLARRRDGAALPVLTRATVLATGGMAALWERTTNPPGAVGAGLGLAEAAGARLADLEFMQFHPTALRMGGVRDGFLITEAVRGEGATLLGADGERFVDELAPRDEVALAIEEELARSGERAVSLDLRAVDLGRFPNIAAALAEVGHRSHPRARARGAGRALHDGRSGHRLRRPLHPARAPRRGRERVQRAPRGQPAGLELPGGMLRVREARRALGLRRPDAPGGDPAPPPEYGPPPLPPDSTRAALWRHAGLRRDAAGLAELARDPFPLARLIAASASRARRAAEPTSAPTTPPPTRALDLMHTLVGGGAEPQRRALGMTTETELHELFAGAMSSLASGVAVITTRRPDGEPCGLAATSVASYSAHPPSVMASIAHSSRCHEALAACEHFGVHILRADEAAVARVFAEPGGRQVRPARLALGRRRARAAGGLGLSAVPASRDVRALRPLDSHRRHRARPVGGGRAAPLRQPEDGLAPAAGDRVPGRTQSG